MHYAPPLFLSFLLLELENAFALRFLCIAVLRGSLRLGGLASHAQRLL